MPLHPRTDEIRPGVADGRLAAIKEALMRRCGNCPDCVKAGPALLYRARQEESNIGYCPIIEKLICLDDPPTLHKCYEIQEDWQ